ncbi:TadA family conjugal transfer-associated ATPase [Actinoplanes sp. NPDC051475]|uniref:TadA family conjugal transfer-associated ATPase n=1 Tax=Actinoplanes sp. NPDC051475 TaxID=3157225 RepID=UPI00344CB51A
MTEKVRHRFAVEGVNPTAAAVVTAVKEDSSVSLLGDTAVRRLADRVRHDLVGAGPLASLLADAEVTDVLVNGTEVWVDRGAGLLRTSLSFGHPDEVRRLAQRLAASCGRRLDDGRPYADAYLPDGTRLHAVLPPVATSGPYLSLRTFRQRPFTLADLVRCGTVPPQIGPLLAAVVEARLAYLVVGGTGSGKTTLLGTLLGMVPATERIVLVEDAAELRPAHPHLVALQTRTSNVEGAGAVSLTDLLRQALRMRPDRLVVGECRGAEVVDLLGALNTGHEGGAGTLHANTLADVPARLEALGLLGGLPRAALHAQVVAALQVILQVRRQAGGRVLDSIGVLLPTGEHHLATVVPAWQRDRGPGPGAPTLGRLLADRGMHVPPVLAVRGVNVLPVAADRSMHVPPAAADRSMHVSPVPRLPR